MDPKEINEQTVQAGQPGCQTETASLSQADMEQQPMTTEEFHRLLKENIERHADERTRHQQVLAAIDTELQDTLANLAIEEKRQQHAYREARQAWEAAKDLYDQQVVANSRVRNEAGRKRHIAQAKEANRWTLNNNIIQSDRHNIFERYRLSGGVLAGDFSELLHPSWSKQDRTKITEDKDNEQ